MSSIETIQRFIRVGADPIVEGVSRVEDLKKFLKKRKPLNYVWISEDAIRMIQRIQYDCRTNQLVGFVQTLDKKTSLPIPFSYNKVSSLLYCYLVQPLEKNAPAFCLNMFGTDNSFTAEDSVKKWSYITKLLEDNGIIVLGYPSDGDPRLLKAMRSATNLGVSSSDGDLKIDGFHASYYSPILYIQDTVHLVIKFKTRLFKSSITIPIGNFLVLSSHLRLLLENFSRDKHLLTKRNLDGKDEMNLDSVPRISSRRVE